MDADTVLQRVLDQNEALIAILREAVLSSNPVGIIQALNPPWQPEEQVALQEPWQSDTPHPPERVDPWGDESIPLERLKPGAGGWVGPEPSEPVEELPDAS